MGRKCRHADIRGSACGNPQPGPGWSETPARAPEAERQVRAHQDSRKIGAGAGLNVLVMLVSTPASGAGDRRPATRRQDRLRPERGQSDHAKRLIFGWRSWHNPLRVMSAQAALSLCSHSSGCSLRSLRRKHLIATMTPRGQRCETPCHRELEGGCR